MKYSFLILFVSLLILGNVDCAMIAEASQQEEQYASILDMYAEAAECNWETADYIDHGLCYVFGYEPSSMGFFLRI